MKKKNLITAGLSLLIIVAAYMLYSTLNAPIKFNNEVNVRSGVIIQKLKDIRTIQRAYKVKYGDYTNNFQELIRFIKNDSLKYEIAMGSEDDSVAVAQGLVSTKAVMLPAKDTLFSGRNINFDELQDIPYTNGKKFVLGTNKVTTESGVEVSVFEIAVPMELYLHDLDKQSIINLKDKKETEFKYPGIRVGSLQKANNDAGSWEE